MAWYAFYNLATGFIPQTFSNDDVRPKPETPEGMGLIKLPLGSEHGGTHKVDVTTDPPTIVALPVPEPVPDVIAQLIAALITAGNEGRAINSDDFHPKTIEAINANLAYGGVAAAGVRVSTKPVAGKL